MTFDEREDQNRKAFSSKITKFLVYNFILVTKQ